MFKWMEEYVLNNKEIIFSKQTLYEKVKNECTELQKYLDKYKLGQIEISEGKVTIPIINMKKEEIKWHISDSNIAIFKNNNNQAYITLNGKYAYHVSFSDDDKNNYNTNTLQEAVDIAFNKLLY